jgi:hypothetical protein
MFWLFICLIEAYAFGVLSCLVIQLWRKHKIKPTVEGAKKLKRSEFHHLIKAKGR